MSNPKFGKGDTVRITYNSSYHGFEIGELVTISSMTDWDSYFGYGEDGEEWAFDDDDCEAIQGVLQ